MNTKERITHVTKIAEEHTAKLEEGARAFARGKITTEALLDLAKKATNAWHAVGRASKAGK